MEEINIKDILNYFKSKIAVIALITLIVAILGCLYSLLMQKPLYRSSTSLLLTGVANGETSITQNDITINQKLVSTYRELAKSKTVLNQVINNLNLNLNYSELNKNVSVTSVQDTELIKITVINENPELAQKIAENTADVFMKEVPNFYNIQNINILDHAEIAQSPYNINVLKQLVIYLFVGLVLGLGIVFITYYFDTTIKTVEEVENKLELPILGQIPLRNKRRK